MNTRLFTLDYLRGFAAFGIMVYHFLFWLNGAFTSDQFMGRVGVYGVAIFYVLSGLTLYHVYEPSQSGKSFSVSGFVKKRIYRIFPLLWLVTLCAIILSRKVPNLVDVLLNITGLFGFVKWDVYFSTGVWSIGNELVFYSVFPILLAASLRMRGVFYFLLMALAILYSYFAFGVIDSSRPLSEQWHEYVNPLNQMFLFAAGIAIGHFAKKQRISNSWSAIMIVVGLLLFTLYPADGNTVQLITGVNRWVFTIACLLVCFGTYKLNVRPPQLIHRALSFLGEASYSVYLLHPLVFTVWAFLFHWGEGKGVVIPWPLLLVIPIGITLVLSYFVYEYFEKYFMRKGRHSSPGSPS